MSLQSLYHTLFYTVDKNSTKYQEDKDREARVSARKTLRDFHPIKPVKIYMNGLPLELITFKDKDILENDKWEEEEEEE